ncbi:MAG TPA: VWA domain-containing protein [Chloroflexota bacterium]|jgi:Ca-activated chloride channel family protein|nr:VWA domain-containing protein [Chloroflexota bacterium]
MSFQWPQLLVGLALLPGLVVLYVAAQRRRRAYALRFANFAVLNAVVTGSPGWRRHVPPLLYLLSLTALLVALARPSAVLAVPRDQASAVLAIDVSGSMSADDLRPSRLAAARQAARAFVDRLPEGTRVGLVTFQSHATVLVPPTVDRDAFRRAVDRLQPNGGTAIGDGLAAALDQLDQRPTDGAGRPTPAVVVLLSDGQTTAGMPPAEAAARAKRAGVKVDTVGIGQRGAAPVIGNNQTVGLDEGTLRQIAAATDGRYFYAGESTELRDIYADLSSEIAWVEEKTEVTALLAGVGSALMVAAGLLGLRWFQQLP